jgi:hypothetical protein
LNAQNQTVLNCDLPPGWSEPLPTSQVALMVVDSDAQILVNGQQMNPWDVIGVFYKVNDEYRCGGFACLNEIGGTAIVTYADDFFTPEKDGFENGDVIYFKVYSLLCAKTFDVDKIVFYPPNLPPTWPIYWPPPGFSAITYMSCTSLDECQITATNSLNADKVFFNAGKWNRLPQVFNSISTDALISLFGNKFIVAKEIGSNKIIWPEMNIYILTEIIPENEYQIMVSEDCWVEWP